MKKIFLLFVFSCFNLGVVFSYSALSESQLLEIDEQINSTYDLSLSEKKEKSSYYYGLAQKSLAIRKAFFSISTVINEVALDSKDEASISYRIALLKKMPLQKRNELLERLKFTQYIAEELGRLYEIESSPLFEGYGVALMPTPVFSLSPNDPDINYVMGGEGTTGLHLDGTNLIRELTVVYPKGTVFSLIKKLKKGKYIYYQVRTREFDGKSSSSYDYYVDSRFIEVLSFKPKDRVSNLPSRDQIKKNLHDALGSAYVWGGTWYQGIPQMTSYFPSNYKLSNGELTQKILKGVDCSGLLYQATDGYTPRNSHGLLGYGEAVDISGNTVDQIVKKLQPLDLIVRGGHVIIVYDKNYVIESRWKSNFKGGVILTKIEDRLKEIFETRVPVNSRYASNLPSGKKFVIRRWY